LEQDHSGQGDLESMKTLPVVVVVHYGDQGI
jgi:hypothetical protein